MTVMAVSAASGSSADPTVNTHDEEINDLNAALLASHKAHVRPTNLTAAEIETLGLVKNGLLMKEIACLLDVSESAIKQRLKNAG